MWKWREKYFGNKVYVYMADKSCFGLSLEISTVRFEVFVGFFGFVIEW